MSEKTIDRIGIAALYLFTEKGYFSTSMKDIAKEVGISAPAIYAHYDSKKDIFIQVVDKCLDLYTKDLKYDIDQLTNVSDEEKLFRFFMLRTNSLKENELMYKFLIMISIFPYQALKDIVIVKLRDNSSVTVKYYQDLYTYLVDRKIIRPVGPEVFIRSLNRLIHGVFFDSIVIHDPFDEETLKSLWQQYWEGIRAR